MGELSFTFNHALNNKNMISFKYLFNASTKYLFAYQRYISLSDMSIFNSPIAITKVATGLSDLYQLFIDKDIYGLLRKDTGKDIHKEQKNATINKNLFLIKSKRYSIKNNYNVFLRKEGVSIDIINFIFLKAFTKKAIINNTLMTKRHMELKRYLDLKSLEYKKRSNIIEQINTERINDDKLNYTNDFLEIPSVDSINLYNNFNVFYHDRITNYYDNLYLHYKRRGLTIYDNIYLRYQDRILNKHDNLYLYYPNRILNRHDNLNLYYPNRILNRHDNLNLYYQDRILNKYKNINDLKRYNILRIIKQTICSPSDKIRINYYQNINLFKINAGKINRLENILAFTDKNKINYYQNVFGNRSVNALNKYDIVFGNRPYNNLNIFKQDNAYRYKDLLDTNKDILLNKQNKNHKMNTNDILSGIQSGKDININDYILNAFQSPKESSLLKDEFVINQGKDSLIDLTQRFIFKDNHSSLINKHLFFKKDNKDIIVLSYNVLSNKNNHETMIDEMFGLIKSGKDIYALKSKTDLIKDGKDIFNFKIDSLYKDRFSMQYHNKIPSLDKSKKSFEYFYQGSSLYKSKKSLYNYDTSFNIMKNRKSFINGWNNVNISKSRKSIDVLNNKTFIYKDGIDINTIYNGYFIHKIPKDANAYQKSLDIFKNYISVKDFTIEQLFKNFIPDNFIDRIINNPSLMIPVSKVQHHSYIEKVNSFVSKIPCCVYINSQKFASVIQKPLQVPIIELFCDKSSHKIFLDYKNEQITKKRINVSIFDNKFASKMYKESFLIVPNFIRKDLKESFIINTINLNKELKLGFVDDDILTSKHPKKGFIEKDFFVKKDLYKCYLHDDLFMKKIPKFSYYTYEIWSNKKLQEAQLNYQERIFKEKNLSFVLDMTTSISEKIKTWYDQDVFIGNIIKDSTLFNEINMIHKLQKDTQVRPDDFNNWVWVYETPDPFEESYGIDELLLPENDTNYEYFEDIVFNKKTMKPRSPVKIIDETTFIAKYPIKHPIEKYSDVAVNYDDSAIKVDQYYGIETEIMREIFLKYYRTWQSKIFEFSTMTMTQAVKTMLEYLYSWIMNYFPVDKIEQALRVFKLIRWYGETAIIQNSQYIISFEYDTLKSKLTTGECNIPNNLGPNNTTMIVDAHLGVIKVNPSTVNNSDAYVEFYIKHKKNTSFTFSLSNTIGSVNIYINGLLKETISSSRLNITYSLPYQDSGMSTIRIEKTAINNKNNIFYIGNIIVPNASFKNLSIEFDPKLRAGNKPLDEMAKKMISCANLYDNREEFYDIIKKNNLGLTETYKMMKEYWDVHHQNKIKGKRLTIKQV